MQMYLWDNYAPNSINPTLKYWADYWEEKIDFFGHTEYGSFFENPRTLIKLIQDEIDFNGLQSKEIRSYFSKRIQFYLQHSYVLDKETCTFFSILRESLAAGTTDIIFSIATECEKKMASGDYVKHLVTQIRNVILSDGGSSKIPLLNDALIIEFVSAGYGHDYIKKIPSSIFDFYQELQEDLIVTNFPIRTEFTKYKRADGKHDHKGYALELKQEMATLTIGDRLEAINRFFFKEEEDLTFIFQLKGAYGDSGSVKIGDVHIYSPKTFSYIKQKSALGDSEDFKAIKGNTITPANVAITLSAKDPDSSRLIALAEIRESLNFLQFYVGDYAELKVDGHSCHIVDSDGALRSRSFKANKREDFWYWNDKAIEINDLNIAIRNGTEVFKNFHRMKGDTRISRFSYEQIAHALHFLDKANKSETDEDRLVNLWVCLEKLMADRKTLFKLEKSKFELINELVPPLILNRLSNKAWTCFNYLKSLHGTSQGNRKCLSLSKELATKIGFETKKGDTVNVTEFLKNIDEVLNSSDREIIREKIQGVKAFYFDNKKALKILAEDEERIKRDLLLIYRLRNKIVHDAHFETFPIRVWADRLASYAHWTLNSIMTNYCKSNERAYEFLMRAKVEHLYRVKLISTGTAPTIYDIAFE